MLKRTPIWGRFPVYVPGSINSHYFHIIGDGHQPNSRGLYTHEIRIPIKGGMTIPIIRSLDCGTFEGRFPLYIHTICCSNMFKPPRHVLTNSQGLFGVGRVWLIELLVPGDNRRSDVRKYGDARNCAHNILA